MMRFLQIFGILALMSSCASNYHFINPPSVEMKTSATISPPASCQIHYRYQVLKEAGNKKYAKKERQSGVSLLAVRIENTGLDTLFFPEHFQVHTDKDTVQILSLAKTGEALRQTTAEDSGNGSVEVDAPAMMAVRDVFNATTQAKANLRFVQELRGNYLASVKIIPGEKRIGLLGLEVPAGTPLYFFINK